jgi:hypothetical protein
VVQAVCVSSAVWSETPSHSTQHWICTVVDRTCFFYVNKVCICWSQKNFDIYRNARSYNNKNLCCDARSEKHQIVWYLTRSRPMTNILNNFKVSLSRYKQMCLLFARCWWTSRHNVTCVNVRICISLSTWFLIVWRAYSIWRQTDCSDYIRGAWIPGTRSLWRLNCT